MQLARHCVTCLPAAQMLAWKSMSMLAGGAADSPLRDLPPPAAVQEPQPQLLPGLLWALRHPGCAVCLCNCSLPLASGQAAEAAGEFKQTGLEAESTNLSAETGWCTSQPVLSACTVAQYRPSSSAAAGVYQRAASVLRINGRSVRLRSQRTASSQRPGRNTIS